MNVPYTAIHFATYESSKTYFGHGDEETLLVQVRQLAMRIVWCGALT